MPKKASIKFNGFLFDVDERRLTRSSDGHTFSLAPKTSSMLLKFISSKGQTVPYDELIKHVWPDGGSVLMGTVRETKRTLNQILSLNGLNIETVSGVGYRLNIELENEKEDEPSTQPAIENASATILTPTGEFGVSPSEKKLFEVEPPTSAGRESGRPPMGVYGNHTRHALASCALYGALYAVALLLEVSYQFDRYGSTALILAPLVFAWVFVTSAFGLSLIRRQIKEERSTLMLSILVFAACGVLLYVALCFYLPGHPVTGYKLQAQTAQAAYLKNLFYFLPLAVVFLIFPFHYITMLEREPQPRPEVQPALFKAAHRMSNSLKGAVYIRVLWLGLLLCFALVVSLAMSSRLLDHLQPHRYMNLFIQLAFWRLILYFALGLECLLWYYSALNNDAIGRKDRQAYISAS